VHSERRLQVSAQLRNSLVNARLRPGDIQLGKFPHGGAVHVARFLKTGQQIVCGIIAERLIQPVQQS
jgi:hypothetical protein